MHFPAERPEMGMMWGYLLMATLRATQKCQPYFCDIQLFHKYPLTIHIWVNLSSTGGHEGHSKEMDMARIWHQVSCLTEPMKKGQPWIRMLGNGEFKWIVWIQSGEKVKVHLILKSIESMGTFVVGAKWGLLLCWSLWKHMFRTSTLCTSTT